MRTVENRERQLSVQLMVMRQECRLCLLSPRKATKLNLHVIVPNFWQLIIQITL